MSAAAVIEPKTNVKVVGANGQISIGKSYAGRQVLVEEREPGVWLVRTAVIIPENERWLHEPQAAADLKAALEWVSTNKSKTDNVEEIFERIRNGKSARKTRSQQPAVSAESVRSR